MAGLALAGGLFAMPACAAQDRGAEKRVVAGAPAAAVVLGGERWHGPRGFKGYGFHDRHGLHRFGGRFVHPFKRHAFGTHRFHAFKRHSFRTFKRHGFHAFKGHRFHRFDGHGIHVFKGPRLRSFPRQGHHRPSIGARIFFFGAPSHGLKGTVVGPFRRHDGPAVMHYRRGGYGER